jgi:hypothetical protein
MTTNQNSNWNADIIPIKTVYFAALAAALEAADALALADEATYAATDSAYETAVDAYEDALDAYEDALGTA